MSYLVYKLHNPYHCPKTGRFTFKPGGAGAEVPAPRAEKTIEKSGAKPGNGKTRKRRRVGPVQVSPSADLAALESFESVTPKTSKRIVYLKRALAVTASLSLAIAAGSLLMNSYNKSREDQERLESAIAGATVLKRDTGWDPSVMRVLKVGEVSSTQGPSLGKRIYTAAPSKEGAPNEIDISDVGPAPPGIKKEDWEAYHKAWRSRPGRQEEDATTPRIKIRRAAAPPLLSTTFKHQNTQDYTKTVRPPKLRGAVPEDVYIPPAPDSRFSGDRGPLFSKQLITIFDVVSNSPPDNKSEHGALATEFVIKHEQARNEAVIDTLRAALSTSPEDYMLAHYGERPDISGIAEDDITGFDDKHIKLYKQLINIRQQITDTDASFRDDLAAETDPEVFSETLKNWNAAKDALLKQELFAANELKKHVDAVQKPLVDARAWDLCHRQVISQQQVMYEQLVKALRYHDALATVVTLSNGEQTATLEDVLMAQDLVEGRRKAFVDAGTTIEALASLAEEKTTPLVAYAAVADALAKISEEIVAVRQHIDKTYTFIYADPEKYYSSLKRVQKPDIKDYESKYAADLVEQRNIIAKATPETKPKKTGKYDPETEHLELPGRNRRATAGGGYRVMVSTGNMEAEGSMLNRIADDEDDSSLGVAAHLIARQAAGGDPSHLDLAFRSNYTASLKSWNEAIARIKQQQVDLKQSHYLETQHRRLAQLDHQFDLCMGILEALEEAHPVVAKMAADNHKALSAVLDKDPTRDHYIMSRYPASGKPVIGESAEVRRQVRQWDYDPDDPRPPSSLEEINQHRKYMTFARFPKLREIWAQEERDRLAAKEEARLRVEAEQRRLAELRSTPEGRAQLAAERAERRKLERRWAREDARKEALRLKQLKQREALERKRATELAKFKKAEASKKAKRKSRGG